MSKVEASGLAGRPEVCLTGDVDLESVLTETDDLECEVTCAGFADIDGEGETEMAGTVGSCGLELSLDAEEGLSGSLSTSALGGAVAIEFDIDLESLVKKS